MVAEYYYYWFDVKHAVTVREAIEYCHIEARRPIPIITIDDIHVYLIIFSFLAFSSTESVLFI